MQSLVAANKDEHKSGRALLSALRHVSPTSPQNLVFLTGTANSGEFSCEARKALDLARCQPKDFINTKAGIAVVVVLCIAAAAGPFPHQTISWFNMHTQDSSSSGTLNHVKS